MEEDIIPQRKKIDISKNGANTYDYHNDFCNVILNKEVVLPNVSAYINSSPPATISSQYLKAWPTYYNDISKLKQSVDYIDSHPEWRTKVRDYSQVKYWTNLLKISKEMYNNICNIHQYNINTVLKVSRQTKDLIKYNEKLKSIIDGTGQYDGPESADTTEKENMKEVWFSLLLSIILSPILEIIGGVAGVLSLFRLTIFEFPILLILCLIYKPYKRLSRLIAGIKKKK